MPPLGSWVLKLSNKALVESPRYVHFSHGPEGSFKVRDFIGRILQQQQGAKRVSERGFVTTKICALTCQEVWEDASRRIPATEENGLYKNVKLFDWWLRKLTEMTDNVQA